MPKHIAAKLILLLLGLGAASAQAQDWIADGTKAFDEGHWKEAARNFEKALAGFDGPATSLEHLAQIQAALVASYLAGGDSSNAEMVLRRSGSMDWRKASGKARGARLNAWGSVHIIQGKLKLAESEFCSALLALSEWPGREEVRATVLNNLASVEFLTGRYAEGLGHSSEALILFEELFGPDHSSLIRIRATLAAGQYMTGQFQEARDSLKRAIAIARKTYGPASTLVGDLRESEAMVMDHLKLRKEAKVVRQQARRILGKARSAAAETLTWNMNTTAFAPNGRLVLQPR